MERLHLNTAHTQPQLYVNTLHHNVSKINHYHNGNVYEYSMSMCAREIATIFQLEREYISIGV